MKKKIPKYMNIGYDFSKNDIMSNYLIYTNIKVKNDYRLHKLYSLCKGIHNNNGKNQYVYLKGRDYKGQNQYVYFKGIIIRDRINIFT